MGSFDRHARLRALIVGSALATALAMPLAVSADTIGGGPIQGAYSSGASISVGAIHLKSKVLATVDVSFTCDPLQAYDWETGTWSTTTAGRIDSASAVIVQASGRSVATASGDSFGSDALCDGSTVQTLSIPVVASTIALKSGAAAAGATVSITDAMHSSNDYASSGAVAVKLGK